MNESPPQTISRQNRFLFACLFEAALGLLAAFIAGWIQRPLWANFQWGLEPLTRGFIAATPIFGILWWILVSPWDAARQIRTFLRHSILPFFGDWAWWQLAALSLIAGVCEEVLFRSVIQGALTPHVGAATAIVVASCLFAIAHTVTLTYAFITMLVGFYLGLIWWVTDNLLVPIVAHFAYDAVALTYLLRAPPHEPEPSETTPTN